MNQKVGWFLSGALFGMFVLCFFVAVVGQCAKDSPEKPAPRVTGLSDHEMLKYIYDDIKSKEAASREFTEALKRGEVPRLPGILESVRKPEGARKRIRTEGSGATK